MTEMSELSWWGIHVMVAQNGLSELILETRRIWQYPILSQGANK
jgi:hypothetical protein